MKKASTEKEFGKGRITIIIGESGWCFVAKMELLGKYVRCTGSSVIRVWGTTNGLGQIALHGPTAETKLDKCGTLRILETKVVAFMDCVQEHWEKHCD